MSIIFHEKAKVFHLYNKEMSYVIRILDSGALGNLYYGNKIHDNEDFTYMLHGLGYTYANTIGCGMESSLEYSRLEYPNYGTSDFRYPAYVVVQESGSHVTNFMYKSHTIQKGKPSLAGLPATYVEKDSEAQTLEVVLEDSLINMQLIVSYTVFEDIGAIARNARFINNSDEVMVLDRALSASIDFPDADYEMIQLSGSWGRERHIKVRKLEQGYQGIGSVSGASSPEQNPFIVLKRPHTTEDAGECFGFSLVYSGNHVENVEVNTYDYTRVSLGIHPERFSWKLKKGEAFQTPEAVFVYSANGLNAMSQAFHELYRTRLARGKWRDEPRPILLNNWEATEMKFTEEKILEIAKKGKEVGVELFVLDDGWFGARDHEQAGLGDWYVTNFEKLPSGITGLADKVTRMGLEFGLWFEPEMVNQDSDLYRAHPDWILHTPGRFLTQSRYQHVLDFSRKEVVDYIHGLIRKVLSEAKISYVKWDMNRNITECFSVGTPADEQGMVFHKYILGVYDLFDRLTKEFPDILFESCASGGGRFDPGLLYYAPQTWTSDDTDAIERLKIQYGTSLVYPVSSMGAHVSAVPNQQSGRSVPMKTRSDVAMFGTFGYEMDLNTLDEETIEQVKKDIKAMKKYRKLIQGGTFYRIKSPFEGDKTSWTVVAKDKSEALMGFYRELCTPNVAFDRITFRGLDINKRYMVNGDKQQVHYGDELMNVGFAIEPDWSNGPDFTTDLFYLKEV